MAMKTVLAHPCNTQDGEWRYRKKLLRFRHRQVSISSWSRKEVVAINRILHSAVKYSFHLAVRSMHCKLCPISNWLVSIYCYSPRRRDLLVAASCLQHSPTSLPSIKPLMNVNHPNALQRQHGRLPVRRRHQRKQFQRLCMPPGLWVPCLQQY